MLETVLAKFITKYLNEYIETLNKSQMEMELWKGNAIFQNLILLPTALTKHQIPFRVKKGTINKINLKIPWKKLKTEACIIEVSDVYIIVELDPDVFIKRDLQAQQSAIHVQNEAVTKEEEKGTWQSLINTVIDNAKVNIQNIHIRIELPQPCGIYAAGVMISNLSLNTCTADRKPINQIVQHDAPKLYKLLCLSNFSIYFDTVMAQRINLNNFEKEMNQSMNSRDHQFIFHPIQLECLLLHTRNVPGMLKNILTVSAEQIKLTLDYSQCRAILDFNQRWAMFNRRRKYAQCARPKNLSSIAETFEGKQRFWFYMFRCAKQKNRPNEFHPKLALTILQNRDKYLKLYRKKEKQKKVPHPILKQQLKKLDSKIGYQAALFLREYSRAVVQKEESVQNSGLTAFDMSELKGLLNAGDGFFEMDSFSLEMSIPSFQIELLYSTNNVLISLIFAGLLTKIKSIETYAEVTFNVMDLTCVSFINKQIRSIIAVDRGSDQFLNVISVIPRTTDPFSMAITLSPVITTLDLETIKCVMEFFVDNTPPSLKKANPQKSMKPSNSNLALFELERESTVVNYLDVADRLQSLLYFKNHILHVRVKKLSYIYPFVYQDKNTNIKFSLCDFTVDKKAVGLLQSNAPEIKMDFQVKFMIDDLLIDDQCLLNRFVFDLPFSFVFYYGKEFVDVACNFTLTSIALSINDSILKAMASALNYAKTLSLNHDLDEKTIQETPQHQEKTVISYGKIKANLDFVLDEVKLIINDTEIGMANIKAVYTLIKSAHKAQFKIQRVNFLDHNNDLLDLPENSTEILITQSGDNEKMIATVIISDLHILLDLKKYKAIYTSMMSLSNGFMTDTEWNTPTAEEIEEGEIDPLTPNRKIPLSPSENKIETPKEEESWFEYRIQMKGTRFEIPDILGNYEMSFNRVDFTEGILFDGFSITRDNRKIVSPTKLQIISGKEMDIKIDGLKSQIDPSDIWAIMRTIDDIKEFLKDDSQPTKVQPDDPGETSVYNVTITDSIIELYDQYNPALILNSNLMTIIMKMDNINMFIDMEMQNFIGNQVIKNAVYKMTDFPTLTKDSPNQFETVFASYHSNPTDTKFILKLPTGKFYFSHEIYEYVFKFVPPPDPRGEKPKVEHDYDIRENYIMKMKDEDSVFDIVLVNGEKESMHFECKNFEMSLNWLNDDSVNFEIKSGSMIGLTKFKGTDYNFLSFPQRFYFNYYHDCMTLRADTLNGMFCGPIAHSFNDSVFAIFTGSSTENKTQNIEKTPETNSPENNQQLLNQKDEQNEDTSPDIKENEFDETTVNDQNENEAPIELEENKLDQPITNEAKDQNNENTTPTPNETPAELKENEPAMDDNVEHEVQKVEQTNELDTPVIDSKTENNEQNGVSKIDSNINEFQSGDITIENKTDSDDSRFKIDFGLVIDIGQMNIEIFPTDFIGPHCNATINNFVCGLKADQRLSALTIKEIFVDIQNANPDRALTLQNIKGVICFNNLKKDISALTINDIIQLEDKREPRPFTLNTINGNWSIDSVGICYTHALATSIIHNFIADSKAYEVESHLLPAVDYKATIIQPKVNDMTINNRSQNKESIQSENESIDNNQTAQSTENNETEKFIESHQTQQSIDQNQSEQCSDDTNLQDEDDPYNGSLVLKADLNINQFKLGLFLIERLASIEFNDMNANLRENIWYANVRQFNLYQGSDSTTSLIQSPHEMDLVKFVWDSDKLNINLAEMTMNLDYLFYLNVVNFVLRSPLLRISSILSFEKEVPQETEVQSEPSQPFRLSMIAPNLRITVPTSIDKTDYPIFNADMDVLVELGDGYMKAELTDFSLYFTDQITKTDYIPFLDKFSVSFVRSIQEDNTIDLSISLSDLLLKVSAIDFVLFKAMLDSINKATEVIMFSEDSGTSDKSANSAFSNLKFDSKLIKIIICRDNRTSEKYIPLFQLVMPPISYQLSTTETVGSMSLTFEPYIQYYNETTGFWDMILEPTTINTIGILTNDQINLSFRIEDFMNLNLPATAVNHYLNLASEIRANMMKIGEKYVELPNFWILNSLGSNAEFTIGNQDQSSSFILDHNQQIPMYNIEMSTNIRVKFNQKTENFTPQYLTYPMMLNDQIMAIRKPFQGGILLEFKSCTEFYNKLSIPIDIFTRNDKSDSFKKVATLQFKERFPLYLTSKPREFLISGHKLTTKLKHQYLTLSASTTSIPDFMIIIDTNKSIKVSLSVKTVASIGTKVFTLFSPIKAVSHLPSRLKMKVENEPEIISLHCEQAIDLFINETKNKFKAAFSIDDEHFGPLNQLKMKSKDPQKILCGGFTTSTGQKDILPLAVIFDVDEDTSQITASFYAPVGMFNFSTFTFNVYEKDENVTAMNDLFTLWCPKAYFQGKMEIPMNIKIFTNQDEHGDYATITNFDCVTPRTDNLFAPITCQNGKSNNKVSIALRYDVSIQSQVSVLTFSPLLHVHNELNENIALQPIDNNSHKICGEPFLISKKTDVFITKMTPEGTFMLSIFSFSTTPILSLLSETKLVFKLQSQDASIVIELEIVDVGTYLECYFRPIVFPTPIVICNTLPVSITAFQLYNVHPVIVEPESTSAFAFDEPLSYPAAHFFIGDEHLHLSLVEDTGYIKTDVHYEGKNIYVSIAKVINGSRAVTISTNVPEVENSFTTIVSLNLSRLNISLIDFHMREFALLSLDNISAEMHTFNNSTLYKFHIDTIQMDDQDPLTPTPVVFCGRRAPKAPFLSFQCIVPSDMPLLTRVLYCSINMQRIDIELDSTFVSDVYYMIKRLTKPKKPLIQPQQAIEKNDSSSIVTCNWLEMSPIYFLIQYLRKSGRKARVHQLFPYLKYIPSLTNRKMLLPGVIVANVSDTMDIINDKITNEYKTQAFHQIIQMLGGGGKLMSAFGVTNMIAEMLNVKIVSDLSSDIKQFSSTDCQVEFDNRRTVNGAFSQESIKSLFEIVEHARIKPSDVLTGLKMLENKDIGIKTKPVSNNGGGQGVLGVLTKTASNLMSNIGRMEKVNRIRVPRAYPNNMISKFDEKISIAQNIIQFNPSSDKKRIEVIRITAESVTQQFVCITDYFVYVFLNDFQGIEHKFDIKLIGKLETKDNVVTLERNVNMIPQTKSKSKSKNQSEESNDTEPNECLCQLQAKNEEEAHRIIGFLKSQKIVLETFGISLLQ